MRIAVLFWALASTAGAQIFWNSGDAKKIQTVPVCPVRPTNGQALVFSAATGQYCPSATAGSGDVLGAASSIDNELVLFSGTGGKTIKRATGTGFVKTASGVVNYAALVSLASDVTGLLAVANGGTGAGTAAGARVALLPAMAGQALKVLRVNAGETDYELATDQTGAGGSAHTIRVNGSNFTQRAALNFLAGAGCTITGGDDAGNNETELTFSCPPDPAIWATYQNLVAGTHRIAAATNSGNAYSACPANANSAWRTPGTVVSVIVSAANTGAATLAYCGAAAAPIVTYGNAALTGAEITIAPQVHHFTWDGTSFRMPSTGGSSDPNTVTAAGALANNKPIIGQGGKAVASADASGNTTEFATVSGAKTTGKQLAFDANGNVIASGSDIGGGGGSPAAGDVLIGIAGLAYTGDQAMVSTRVYTEKFTLAYPQTFTKIRFVYGASWITAGQGFRAAIYNHDGSTKLFETPAYTTTTFTAYTVLELSFTAPTQLAVGAYRIALTSDGTPQLTTGTFNANLNIALGPMVTYCANTSTGTGGSLAFPATCGSQTASALLWHWSLVQ